MKNWLIAVLLLSVSSTYAQKFISSNTFIKFYSSAPLEDIEAENEEARSFFDAATGDLAFVVPIESFQFPNKFMQEHFNENYLESDKYPEASFQARIVDWKGKEGLSTASATGTMTLHGVSQEIEVEGTIQYAKDAVEVNAVFPIKLEDYKIKIPKAVFYKIAEEIEVTVKFEYVPYVKS